MPNITPCYVPTLFIKASFPSNPIPKLPVESAAEVKETGPLSGELPIPKELCLSLPSLEIYGRHKLICRRRILFSFLIF
ncbi:hypothetical protein CEXT_331081 [Caerostris extrusa]|uniref:Uncharacterized protein n=1 Tax=Caerostris extrusa TaxID=172846 RepID=A0AAV4V998_CAEEX|nr:hypothetical protein CEXT_331081 [Caerostris extrusa]